MFNIEKTIEQKEKTGKLVERYYVIFCPRHSSNNNLEYFRSIRRVVALKKHPDDCISFVSKLIKCDLQRIKEDKSLSSWTSHGITLNRNMKIKVFRTLEDAMEICCDMFL